MSSFRENLFFPDVYFLPEIIVWLGWLCNTVSCPLLFSNGVFSKCFYSDIQMTRQTVTLQMAGCRGKVVATSSQWIKRILKMLQRIAKPTIPYSILPRMEIKSTPSSIKQLEVRQCERHLTFKKGMIMFKVTFSSFSNINQSACSTLDWPECCKASSGIFNTFQC